MDENPYKAPREKPIDRPPPEEKPDSSWLPEIILVAVVVLGAILSQFFPTTR